jgi:hypothetical protein
MPVSRSLCILFIRDSKKFNTDDAIIVTPSKASERMFSVQYRDSLNNIRNRNLCNETEILDFVENMFNLLTADCEPFESIQLTAPMFPPILLNTPRLHNPTTRDAVMSVVKNTVRNWPSAEELHPTTSATRPVSAPSTRPVTRSMSRDFA